MRDSSIPLETATQDGGVNSDKRGVQPLNEELTSSCGNKKCGSECKLRSKVGLAQPINSS
jgi:hypothetical protein